MDVQRRAGDRDPIVGAQRGGQARVWIRRKTDVDGDVRRETAQHGRIAFACAWHRPGAMLRCRASARIAFGDEEARPGHQRLPRSPRIAARVSASNSACESLRGLLPAVGSFTASAAMALASLSLHAQFGQRVRHAERLSERENPVEHGVEIRVRKVEDAGEQRHLRRDRGAVCQTIT